MNRLFRRSACGLAFVLGVFAALPASASPVRLLVESNDDRDAGSEVVSATAADFAGLVNANLTQQFTALNIGANFGLAGVAYDGAYHVLVESNDDRAAGAELFLASFPTFQDLVNNTNSTQTATQINVGPNFGIGGFAYDGAYHLLVESNDDRDAGAEVIAASFASLSDLINFSGATQSTTQINVGPNFDLSGFGFDFDTGLYHLLVESIVDMDAGSEVFSVNFPSFADLVGFTNPTQSGTQLNIGPQFGLGGFAIESLPGQPVIPEPSTVVLVGVGLLAGWRWRKR